MIGTDDDDLDLDIDLELYCCKFYDKDIEVKHTYFLIIPTDKDNTTIHINPKAQPNNETVKQWLQQPRTRTRTNPHAHKPH